MGVSNSNRITIGAFMRKLAGFSMASWLSAGISFLITPVFTRLYAPDQAGHINLFLTYETFFQTVCVFALDQAFMRFYNEDLEGLHKGNLLSYCLRINLSLSSLSAVVILAWHSFFSEQIAAAKTWLVPICLVIVVICGTFLRMSSISSRMEGKVVQYSLQVVLITVAEKVFCTLTALFRPEFQTAIITITLGFIGICFLFVILKRKQVFSHISNVPLSTAKTIFKFSVPYLPVLLLSWLNGSIPLFVLRRYVDYTAIGVYTSAVTIANILSLIQSGFSACWGPFVYENYKDHDNLPKIQSIVRAVVLALFLLSFAVILFQDIIYLLLGRSYRASKVFFPFLMFTPICNCLGDIMGIGIMLSKKSYLNIITFSGCALTNLILSFVLVPNIGIMGAGIAVAVSAMVMLSIRGFFGMKYFKSCGDIRPIVFSVFLLSVACVINGWVESSYLKYGAVVLLIVATCAIFRDELFQMVELIGSRIKNREGS